MQVVLSKGVDEGKILFLSLIAAPEGIHMVCKKFPRVKVITSEIDEGIDESTFQVIPGELPWKDAAHAFDVPNHYARLGRLTIYSEVGWRCHQAALCTAGIAPCGMDPG